MIGLRTSHRYIHKMINEAKSKISDEEFFISEAFAGYLEDIAEVVAKRYKRPIKLNIFYNEDNPFQACTDNRYISINAGNKEISTLGNRNVKVSAVIGLLGHELGHINFTDFTLMGLFKTKISKGIFYPSKPIPENAEEEANFEEIKDLLKAKDQIAIGVITSVLSHIENILEDAYIEARMCNDFPGKIKKCIIMKRALSIDNTLSILEQIDAKYDGLAIMLNLILSYATAGRINNDGNYTGEYLDKLIECIKLIDNSVCCNDFKERLKSSLQLLLKLWKYVKEVIEKQRSSQEQPNQSKSSSGRKSSKAKKEAREQCDNSLAGQIIGKTIEPKGIDEAVDTQEAEQTSGDDDENEIAETKKEIQQAVVEELGRLNNDESSSLQNTNGSGIVRKDNNFAGSGYENVENDINRILKRIAEEKVNEVEEDNLAKNIQNEADNIYYGDIHRNANITIHRINPISDYLKQAYNTTSPKLILLSKKLQKGIKNVVINRKFGGKLNGLYMGRRVEARSFVRDDGRYFYKKVLPEELDIAISVLVDESGSMASQDRITIARATSLVLYDFCHALNIPISILGHTADDGEVDLYSYANFDSVDGNDRYRIMDMCSRNCNRDGMALRYVAENLMKRTESIKLLIIISDGQPNDIGYCGMNAEKDLSQIKSEYTKKGITLFAAAIGDDKETIKRIYKDGFLDITDLNKMPVNLIKLITKYVK